MTRHQDTPAHLLPSACHICGSPETSHQAETPWTSGHRFWSNADADADADREAAKTVLTRDPIAATLAYHGVGYSS